MTVSASCPARIDIGNSLDYPDAFYAMPNGTARTLNICLSLRTRVSLTPTSGRSVELRFGAVVEKHRSTPRPERSRLPILCSVLRHLDVRGCRVEVRSDVPERSGLGGSAMLLLSTLAVVARYTGAASLDRSTLALVAHLFENSQGFSRTGFQDQLAAVHGGANLWVWGTRWRGATPVFDRVRVVPRSGHAVLGKHLLLAFTGRPHRSLSFRPRGLPPLRLDPLWHEVSRRTHAFAVAVARSSWKLAGRHLNAECQIRRRLAPRCVSARAAVLLAAARASGAGARYAGHGHGGCVWAIGDLPSIHITQRRWARLCANWPRAWVIRPRVSPRGLIMHP